MKVANE
jgi:hypothetical protein